MSSRKVRITVEITNDQSHVPLDEGRLRRAVQMILRQQPIPHAQISLAVVDDPAIRELHRKYLEEDEPTDVLSFVLERSEDCLEGAVVVSGETARATAPQFGWPAEDELLLYVIHGVLHLVGYEDATPPQQAAMRAQERAYLSRFGVEARWEASAVDPARGDASATGSSAAAEKEVP